MKHSMKNKLATCISLFAVATLTAGLTSCADDLNEGGSATPDMKSKMAFKVFTQDYLDAPTTRAAQPEELGYMTSNNGGEALSVVEVIDNSITSDGSGRTPSGTTRGIPVENLEFATTTGYNGFKLMAATYDDSKTWLTAKDDVVATNFINKLDVLGTNDFETEYIWPGQEAAKKVAFFAWAPYTNTTANTSVASDLTVDNEQGAPKLTYTVPVDNVSKQFDLITATAVDVPGDHNNVQQLQFNHVLSCIKFAAGNLRDCKITDIKLTNIHYKGTYTFPDATGEMGTWENTGDLKTICIGKGETADSKDVQSRITDQEANFILNAGEKNLMMLPQTLEQGAQLQVSFVFNSVDMEEKKTDSNGAKTAENNGTISRTYTIDLSGRRWESGKTYTYILTTNSVNNILLVERPANFSFNGTTEATFRVSSYKYINGGQTQPLAWTTKYYACTEDGSMGEEIEKPSWIETTTDAATNLTGGYQAYDMKLVAQQMTATGGAVSAITDLQNAEPIGTEAEPVDLSLRDVMGNELANGRSTANCYVVRQPGWYTFPLVYGNGIRDGAENGESLGSTTKINADGNTINNAYIYLDNDRGEDAIGDAVIIWQDAPQLITPASVQLTDDKHGIKFQIEKRHITQGNAVLSVRDNDKKILWSWHIWVTAADLGNTATIKTANNDPSVGITSAELMRVPLGYCDGVTMEYKQRDFFVQIIQTESGKTATFKVTQDAKETAKYYGPNAAYYNWGRNVPMLPKGNGNTDKQYYDSSKDNAGNKYTFTKYGCANNIALGTVIQNPFTLYYSNPANNTAYWIYATKNLDLWNVGSSVISLTAYYPQTKKTIYDPCPVGYCVPSSGVYSLISVSTCSGQIAANTEQGMPAYIETTLDGTAYANKTDNADVIKFPILGYRYYSSAEVCQSEVYGTLSTSQMGNSGGEACRLQIYNNDIKYVAWSATNAVMVLPCKQ